MFSIIDRLYQIAMINIIESLKGNRYCEILREINDRRESLGLPTPWGSRKLTAWKSFSYTVNIV